MYKDVLSMLFKLLVWWVVAFLFFGLLIMQCSQKTEASVTITDVIYAIEEVESNRDPYAINKQENALGSLQIRPIMIEDCRCDYVSHRTIVSYIVCQIFASNSVVICNHNRSNLQTT